MAMECRFGRVSILAFLWFSYGLNRYNVPGVNGFWAQWRAEAVMICEADDPIPYRD